jgi:hypothetical protein
MMSPGDIWVKNAHSSGGNLSLGVSVLPSSLVRETKSSNLVSKFDFQKRDSMPVQLTSPGVWASMGRTEALLMVKFRQPSHEFTFGVGMTFISYPLVQTPVV